MTTLRTSIERPIVCELCSTKYRKKRDGVLVINHRGAINGDLWECIGGCGDEVVELSENYHSDPRHRINQMVKHYPQHIIDMRDDINIFAVWDGLGSSVLYMDKLPRELEASTWAPDMMVQKWGLAQVDESQGGHGVKFIYKPRSFLTCAAILKIKRFKDTYQQTSEWAKDTAYMIAQEGTIET